MKIGINVGTNRMSPIVLLILLLNEDSLMTALVVRT